MIRKLSILVLTALFGLASNAAWADEVRVKDLGRFLGWRDNPLVGYGIVTGLAGSGDSPRNQVTQQALKNVLSRLGANIPATQVQSRNVAAVIVTARLPASSHVGDQLDVIVSSIGDARSLAGGALLMTPLLGPDQRPYALAQGPLVVGGYFFESNLNQQQKNYPTSAVLPGGATVESAVSSTLLGEDRTLTFVLKDPDVTTAQRIAAGINASVGSQVAFIRDASAVGIHAAQATANSADLYQLISRIEDVSVTPASLARVVINERSGTIVAGDGVRISSVVISQGDIKVSVSTDNQASQPVVYGEAGSGVRSLIVTNTRLEVADHKDDAAVRFPNTTVADLVTGLKRVHVDTRGMINILQAIKAAGALHAEIIVQ